MNFNVQKVINKNKGQEPVAEYNHGLVRMLEVNKITYREYAKGMEAIGEPQITKTNGHQNGHGDIDTDC
ncbi:hypothetical protein GCM10007962_13470 [Yeosuana aromativorans]|uniref:Uncharacterized protein n=1 Tax=Yeosuana aromativorans TaxID=288019 RepID=A0A8J3BMV4_9FLAO|nr:hypothetical protein [Yeosuana aromativorans]GGK20663.1 hypothetical protein GCM10007962_13470 [Yeosuana aromativorans]